MPTHKKGHDKDKYYHLAKDQGFRSRAAFKLIQINRRFDILSKSRVCIDLCAAPGGWCQVAAKFMPPGSIIIGVDLLPIKAIRNVKTLVSDITSSECRKLVSNELQGWNADVVLCDGAPNIGSSYSKDAYVQNELVLAALRTATMHLSAGGSFCTKVYRSVDYNSLIWVFQQLFEDVQAMKPSSSRSQSSEIFIVCLKYTAPKFIDPKLLDPNHVFKELSGNTSTNKTVDILHKKHDDHNKRHRSGYDNSQGILLHIHNSMLNFIQSKDPVRLLTDTHELRITPSCIDFLRTNGIDDFPEDIVEYSKDLRILNKSDFKKLLKWRTKIRADLPIDNSSKEAGGEGITTVTSATNQENEKIHSDENIEDEIMKLRYENTLEEKKALKKLREAAAKERTRQNLGMTNNAFEETGNTDLFSFSSAKNVVNMKGKDFADIDDIHPESDDDEDDDLYVEDENDVNEYEVDDLGIDDAYDEHVTINSKKVKHKARDFVSFDEKCENPRKNSRDEIMESVGDGEELDLQMPKSDKDIRSEKRRKLKERQSKRKANLSLADEETDDFDVMKANSGGVSRFGVDEGKNEVNEINLDEKTRKYRDDIIKGMGKTYSVDESNKSILKNQKRDFEIVSHAEPDQINDGVENFAFPAKADDRDYSSDDDDDHEKVKTLALGTLMLSKPRKKALVDSSYNRYSWNDPSDLPDWFIEDELKHNKPEIPIPAGLISQIKGKFQDTKAAGTKEIKKVAEARARKRKRALVKLKAAKKKATAMAENSDVTGRAKVKAISQALRAAKSENKPNKRYVVTGKTQGSSSGTLIGSGKGKLKFVDKRLKKDQRNTKMSKKRKRSRH